MSADVPRIHGGSLHPPGCQAQPEGLSVRLPFELIDNTIPACVTYLPHSCRFLQPCPYSAACSKIPSLYHGVACGPVLTPAQPWRSEAVCSACTVVTCRGQNSCSPIRTSYSATTVSTAEGVRSERVASTFCPSDVGNERLSTSVRAHQHEHSSEWPGNSNIFAFYTTSPRLVISARAVACSQRPTPSIHDRHQSTGLGLGI
jgi:hypothetical protein